MFMLDHSFSRSKYLANAKSSSFSLMVNYEIWPSTKLDLKPNQWFSFILYINKELSALSWYIVLRLILAEIDLESYFSINIPSRMIENHNTFCIFCDHGRYDFFIMHTLEISFENALTPSSCKNVNMKELLI